MYGNQSTKMNEIAEKQIAPAPELEPMACGTNTCSTGVCSPCVAIWGLVALYFLVTTLLEYFR